MSVSYSESESDVDAKHDELLKEIKHLDHPLRENRKSHPRVSLKAKTVAKIDFDELVGSVKSTRNLNDLKKRLVPIDNAKKQSSEANVQKKANNGDVFAQKKKRVLDAPLHRQKKRRIESEIAYNQSKRELSQWNPVVHSYRVAEQICFPLGEEKSVHVTCAEDKAEAFQPKTELERLTAEVLGKSKYTIKNKEAYSEAEKELIKSMSLKEAKKKCAELQKMRALMSYKAAKLKHQSKIKSKRYHRILKRQKHRELIKEIEDLMVRDPEKAKDKLGELEKDRAHERGTLKHRAIKWSRHMRQTKNPELKKLMEDHLRLGRELKSRHELHADDDESDKNESEEEQDTSSAKPLTVGEIVKLAVEQADREADAVATMEKSAESMQVNPFYRSALENLRREHRRAEKAQKMTGNDKKNSSQNRAALTTHHSKHAPEKVENQAAHKKSEKRKPEEERDPIENSSHVAEKLCFPFGGGDSIARADRNESANNVNILENILELDNTGAVEEDFLAEAYENDSVLGDFEEEKQRVEDEEKPEALDLTLHGWGSWTGPGITDRKKDRFVVKPKQNKRKDARRPGVIIRETISSAVADLQPRDVPFPFTSAKDFETFIQQPLGAAWNTPSAHAKLIQPRIKTKAGRIIRAVDKEEKNRHNVAESDSDD